MKRAKGEGVWDTANLNQMIFYVKYELMGSSGLIGLQILKGLRRKATGLRAVLGACEIPIRGHAKDIATQMAGILALASVRTTGYRLATDNKKGAVALH